MSKPRVSNAELDVKYNNLSRLCNAINNVPFVCEASYWGGDHNSEFLNVRFHVRDEKSLMIIARALDNRYGGPPAREYAKRWFLYVECMDVEPGYSFGLRSFNKEEYAYEWADKIADNIEDTLEDNNVLGLYGIKKESEIEKERQKELDKKELDKQEYLKLLKKSIEKHCVPFIGLEV